MARSINPTPQYFDNAGDPLSGGKMYYFIGGTTTPLTTYADVNQTIANEHPVILDGAGRLPNVFFDGTARQVLEDADGVQIWEREPVESSAGNGGSFQNYDAQTIYSENDVVIATDGNYYRSLTSGNQNNTPQSSPTQWNKVQFLEDYNENITYSLGDNVRATDGKIYRSRVASNLNNNPALSPAQWRDLEGAEIQFWSTDDTYAANDNVTYNGRVYRSLIASNTGNQPDTSPTAWQNVAYETIGPWDAGITYAVNAMVIRTGKIYKSLVSSNLGNDPATSMTDWRSLEPDAQGLILNPGNVFDGYGVLSVTNAGAGVHDVVFNTSATNTNSQVVLAINGGNSSIVISPQQTGAATCTIRGWLSDTATPTNQYPIQVSRWFVD